MKLFIEHNATLTPWAVNWIWEWIIQKKFIFNWDLNNINWIQNWIKTYNDYLNYYESWDKRWKTRLYNKIQNFKDQLYYIYWYFVDPILYIIKLYYLDNLSIKDVWKRLNDLWWWNNDETSIEKTFKQTFWWDLRDNLWTDISKKKRNFEEQIKNAREINDENNRKKYEILKNFFERRIEAIINIKIEEFDKKWFENLNKTWKILYILYFFYWINRNEILNLRKSEIWSRVISTFINQNIENLLKKLNIDLIIYPKDIQWILNELN